MEKITVTFNYITEDGDNLNRSETVSIVDGFPTPMDVIAAAMESFLEDIGALRRDEILFVDTLNSDEMEAVTDELRMLRDTDQ